jgi:hypothetical protein
MDGTCHLEALVGREARCEGDGCGFWQDERGCVLEASRAELAGRPEVARLLLEVRDRLTAGRETHVEDEHAAFARSLNKTAQHDLA